MSDYRTPNITTYGQNYPDSPLLHLEKSFYEDFRKVFRSFHEVFRNFCEFFEAFWCVRTHSDPFGPIGMHLDAFGNNWKRLDVFEFFLRFFGFLSRFSTFPDVMFTKDHGTIYLGYRSYCYGVRKSRPVGVCRGWSWALVRVRDFEGNPLHM